jgi:5-methylcytosine-specific restriction endonuclease McrA
MDRGAFTSPRLVWSTWANATAFTRSGPPVLCRYSDKRVNQVNRRRAWKYGNGESEKFTRTEIGERDGWVCRICGDPIDMALRFPDRQSQSLDHIVPLSAGGVHTRQNSRIAHWICNVQRNADRKNYPCGAAG